MSRLMTDRRFRMIALTARDCRLQPILALSFQKIELTPLSPFQKIELTPLSPGTDTTFPPTPLSPPSEKEPQTTG
jgi:hypothetical protein